MNHIWTAEALVALRELANERSVFTSDDLYAKVDTPPHHNMVGDAFREARRIGLIEMTGQSIQSGRPLSKGRRIQVWRKAGTNAVYEAPQRSLL